MSLIPQGYSIYKQIRFLLDTPAILNAYCTRLFSIAHIKYFWRGPLLQIITIYLFHEWDDSRTHVKALNNKYLNRGMAQIKPTFNYHVADQ